MIDVMTQYFVTDAVYLKDFLLGFFIALTLRRGRITAILDKLTPTENNG